VPVPIVCSKRLFFQNLGMSAGADNNGVSQTALITIVDSAHPLAGGRNGLFSPLNRIAQIGWGRPVPSAMRVATVPGEPERTVIFALEKGAPAPFGPAPARRVGWFALDFSTLNPGGWMLFDAAIKWAQGAP
jgi:hypothetical protein